VNPETIRYALIVAVVGMAIVFIFLAFLSVLMAVITRILGDRPVPPEEQPAEGGQKPKSAGNAPQGTPVWVYAAAAAYLDLEDRGSASSKAWVATRSHGTDAWIAGRTGGESFNLVRNSAL
jgi:Na+-transporting methylmalonyl-CoA/oxaloacetate decarboxylase gamma subunit